MKLIPCFVDGPRAIKLLRPKPIEVIVNNDVMHPATWFDVPPAHDPITKKKEHAILELDMNFVSSRGIRRILSIARPHLQSITIDIAFIISKPVDSQDEEPNACLGLFRVDKVDFEKFAVTPVSTLDESMEEIKSIMEQSDLDVPRIIEEEDSE